MTSPCDSCLQWPLGFSSSVRGKRSEQPFRERHAALSLHQRSAGAMSCSGRGFSSSDAHENLTEAPTLSQRACSWPPFLHFCALSMATQTRVKILWASRTSVCTPYVRNVYIVDWWVNRSVEKWTSVEMLQLHVILPAWAGSSDPAPGPWGEWGAPMAAELTVWCLQLTSVWWQPPRGAPGPTPTLVKKVTQSPQSSSGSEWVVVDLTHPDWFIWPQCVSTEIWGSPSSHCTSPERKKHTRPPWLSTHPCGSMAPGGWGSPSASSYSEHSPWAVKGLFCRCCEILLSTYIHYRLFNCIPFMIFSQTKAL